MKKKLKNKTISQHITEKRFKILFWMSWQPARPDRSVCLILRARLVINDTFIESSLNMMHCGIATISAGISEVSYCHRSLVNFYTERVNFNTYVEL